MAAGAVSLRKSHDIVILSFCYIVKGQAKGLFFADNCLYFCIPTYYIVHGFLFFQLFVTMVTMRH